MLLNAQRHSFVSRTSSSVTSVSTFLWVGLFLGFLGEGKENLRSGPTRPLHLEVSLLYLLVYLPIESDSYLDAPFTVPSSTARMPHCCTSSWDGRGDSTICWVCEFTFNNGGFIFGSHIYWTINPKCVIYPQGDFLEVKATVRDEAIILRSESHCPLYRKFYMPHCCLFFFFLNNQYCKVSFPGMNSSFGGLPGHKAVGRKDPCCPL